ncbi:MAG TPA: HAD-IG family 5'-nucleotidase [Candidatus Rifleibacterium sp.]|nr:HAD-IG family 5'-nucleotidase [Candidatus Rifleibacterium sp.]
MKEKEIPCKNKIFVNRTLNMNTIKLIGFDMDYTLVTYNVPAFEAKAYEILKEKLIRDYKYPEDIKSFEFNKDFIIRGLVIDTENGDFLKVNRYGFVRVAAHGSRFYSFEEQKEKFGPNSIDLLDARYYIVHTLFSQAEGCMYAQLVDYYDSNNHKISYRKLFTEVRKCLNDAHQEEELKGDVVSNPAKYLIQDQHIVDALLKFKKFGKKLALITNSDYEYSRKVMEYCFGPYLKTPWQKLFDLVIVSANKPDYFTTRNRYLRVNPETGTLSNFYGPIEWNGLYQGGNAAILEKNLNLSPSEILYLSDHILGDVVTLKETIGWRTGLVVQELAEEVPILEETMRIHQQIAEKMAEKESLEDIALEHREKMYLKEHDRSEASRRKYEDVKDRLIKLDDEIRDLIIASQKGFNQYWGEVMRAGNEISRFATLVERYACIYMSGIANLDYYSPFKYYRSQRRFLAHDPQ